MNYKKIIPSKHKIIKLFFINIFQTISRIKLDFGKKYWYTEIV